MATRSPPAPGLYSCIKAHGHAMSHVKDMPLCRTLKSKKSEMLVKKVFNCCPAQASTFKKHTKVMLQVENANFSILFPWKECEPKIHCNAMSRLGHRNEVKNRQNSGPLARLP